MEEVTISEAVQFAVVPPRPRRGGNRGAAFEPTEEQRNLVERLAAFNISRPAICAELVRDGVPCHSVNTLDKKFRRELELGRERMKIAVGQKVLDIALSDRPHNLAACLAILRMLDPAWREPKDSETAEAQLPSAGALIYPRRDLERDLPPEPPTIDGELEPEEPSRRTTIEI